MKNRELYNILIFLFFLPCSFDHAIALSSNILFMGNKIDIPRSELRVFPMSIAPTISLIRQVDSSFWNSPDFKLEGRGKHWISFSIENITNSQQTIAVDLNWSFVREASYYAFSRDLKISELNTSRIGKGFNPQTNTTALFSFDLNTREKAEIYIMVNWDWGFNPLISVSNLTDAQKNYNRKNILRAAYTSGIIVILVPCPVEIFA